MKNKPFLLNTSINTYVDQSKQINRFSEGIRVNIRVEISPEGLATVKTTGFGDSRNRFYVIGLIRTGHDDLEKTDRELYTLIKNVQLPTIETEFDVSEKVLEHLRGWNLIYKQSDICMDSKEKRSFNTARSRMLDHFHDLIKCDLGFRWLGKTKIPQGFIDDCETAVSDYVDNVKQIRNDLIESRQNDDNHKREQEKLRYQSAVDVLVQNGFDRNIAENITVEAAVASAISILNANFISENEDSEPITHWNGSQFVTTDS